LNLNKWSIMNFCRSWFAISKSLQKPINSFSD